MVGGVKKKKRVKFTVLAGFQKEKGYLPLQQAFEKRGRLAVAAGV